VKNWLKNITDIETVYKNTRPIIDKGNPVFWEVIVNKELK